MSTAVLAVRVVVGAVFVVAGASKIGHADVFAAQIAAFGILPRAVVAPMALVLPFLEVLLGGYLILGLFTRVAAWVAVLQLLVFAAAIATAVMQGRSLSCGCFGPNDTTVTSWPEVARDLALALLAAFVAWRAPGMLALDRRIGDSK
ncbi:MAG: MauE/DoxX family redox-associated membrane protein [Candidatus Velthaea sp.]